MSVNDIYINIGSTEASETSSEGTTIHISSQVLTYLGVGVITGMIFYTLVWVIYLLFIGIRLMIKKVRGSKEEEINESKSKIR